MENNPSKFAYSRSIRRLLPLLVIILLIIFGAIIDKLTSEYRFQVQFFRQNESLKPSFQFTNVTAELGIVHSHSVYSGRIDEFSPQSGLGATVLTGDIDHDGFLDLFFTNSKKGESNRLYKNEQGRRFVDITESSGIGTFKNTDSATEAAIFVDFNNDGFLDLVISSGCIRIFRSQRDGTFQDVTKETLKAPVCANTAGISLVDYNKDGYLDLYLSNVYKFSTQYSSENLNSEQQNLVNKSFARRVRLSDDPKFGGENILLKNNSGTSFEVVKQSGAEDPHYSYATAVGYFNNDHWPDLLVANDYHLNRLFLNSGGQGFNDKTDQLGRQYLSGNMSAATGDVNGDGFIDVFVSNVSISKYGVKIQNKLYFSDGQGLLADRARELNIGRCGWAWGGKLFDVDRDGDLDLVIVNGHFDNGEGSFWYRYTHYLAMPGFLRGKPNTFPSAQGRSIGGQELSCLFLNQDGKFYDVAEEVGISDHKVGRGVISFDYDNDGDLDLAVANFNQEPIIYKNEQQNQNHWVGLILPRSNRKNRSIGARITLLETNAGTGKTQYQEHYPANGFMSQSDERIFFGIASNQKITVKIQWADGLTTTLDDLKIDQYNQVLE